MHSDSRPRDARLSLGLVDIGDVVLTTTLIAGKLQFRELSGSIFGFTKVVPH